jgi:hypothetical protein
MDTQREQRYPTSHKPDKHRTRHWLIDLAIVGAAVAMLGTVAYGLMQGKLVALSWAPQWALHQSVPSPLMAGE